MPLGYLETCDKTLHILDLHSLHLPSFRIINYDLARERVVQPVLRINKRVWLNDQSRFQRHSPKGLTFAKGKFEHGIRDPRIGQEFDMSEWTQMTMGRT